MKKWILRSTIIIISFLVLSTLIMFSVYLYYLNIINGSLNSSGEDRKYLLYVPESYDPSTPTELIISLHTAFTWPSSQQKFTHWNKLADREGFIVVYPAASGFPPLWNVAPGSNLEAETQFFEDLIDELSSQYNIDTNRVYANGFSNGAAMTFMLSCTLPNKIAAFGMVATPVVPWEWCQNRQPTPIIAFHGIEDPLSLYHGGENALTTEPLISMQEWISLWGIRNLCGSSPIDSIPVTGVTLRQYSNCAQGVTARLYAFDGAGHVWPGGLKFAEFTVNLTGPYTDRMDATEEMWSFFKEYSLNLDSD